MGGLEPTGEHGTGKHHVFDVHVKIDTCNVHVCVIYEVYNVGVRLLYLIYDSGQYGNP